MAQFITLEYYQAAERKYHANRISNSAKDGQTHYHDYFQVCYVAEGWIQHRWEQDVVILRKGDAFIIPPGFPHSLHFEPDEAQVLLVVFQDSLFHEGFKLSSIAGFLMDLQRDAIRGKVHMRISLEQRQRRNVEALLEMLIAEQEADNPQGLTAAPSLISSVLHMLAQCYYGEPRKAMERNALVGYVDTMQRCTDYIDRNYEQRLTLEGLSRKFGVSRSAFCTAFRQYTGVPLRQYIARRRIQEAQIRIRSGQEASLSQIAQAVGYEDDSTFYRNFLRIAGVSPARYRQLCKESGPEEGSDG